MKKAFLFLSLFIVISLACDLSVTVAPPSGPTPVSTNTLIPVLETIPPIPASATPVAASATPVPATIAPPATPTWQQPSLEGMAVTYGPMNLILPLGVASGFSGDQLPRADGENVAPWVRTPGHTQIKLEGYFLQGKFHEPQIYVYPASDYALMFPAAFESIHRLDNILYGPGGSISEDQLPTVPFFQAAQLFASNVQVKSFQNGSGVRFLTQYAQYAASINNHELFYHFQGVTRDGEYYIIAILPVSVSVLAETSDAGAALPDGGVPYPYFADPDADMRAYYTAVTALLDVTTPEAFSPTIDQLDSLIESMRIGP